MNGAFDLLDPQVVLDSVETVYGVSLDGSLSPYSSYVNRVYGVRSVDGEEYVAKFYRPGRWSVTAIEEEHAFVLDCVEAELPVVAPIEGPEGATLHEVEVDAEAGGRYAFALYPKRGGRGFDAERDEDWFRLGALVGRVHSVGAHGASEHRLICTPRGSTVGFVEELDNAEIVHPDVREEFFALAAQGIELIDPLFTGIDLQRIHGDLHRGNILERGDEGLLLIDFDDTMVGPAVQDLWLLLPDRITELRREIVHLLEGYRQFSAFDERQLELVEPLRFMRILYYLAWSALQRDDYRFRNENPEWGTKAFWIREIEDLRTQLTFVAANRTLS